MTHAALERRRIPKGTKVKVIGDKTDELYSVISPRGNRTVVQQLTGVHKGEVYAFGTCLLEKQP